MFWRETSKWKWESEWINDVNEAVLECFSLIKTEMGKSETMATVFLNLHRPTSFYKTKSSTLGKDAHKNTGYIICMMFPGNISPAFILTKGGFFYFIYFFTFETPVQNVSAGQSHHRARVYLHLS